MDSGIVTWSLDEQQIVHGVPLMLGISNDPTYCMLLIYDNVLALVVEIHNNEIM